MNHPIAKLTEEWQVDSVKDFSNVQGANGWSYHGAASSWADDRAGAADERLIYDAALKRWMLPEESEWFVEASTMQSTPNRVAIRRWTSPVQGTVRVSGGAVGLMEATRMLAIFRVDGAIRRVIRLNGTLPRYFDFPIPVDVGSSLEVGLVPETGMPRVQATIECVISRRFHIGDPVGPSFSEREKERQLQAGQKVYAAIMEAFHRGAPSFVIEPGDYRFDSSPEHRLTFQGLRDFKLLAQGVTFWFHREPTRANAPACGLHFRECSNVTVEGLAIDYDIPTYIQARITELTDDGQVQAAIMDGYPDVANAEMNATFYKPDGSMVQHRHTVATAITVKGRTLSFRPKIMRPMPKEQLVEDPYAAYDTRSYAEGDYVALVYRNAPALLTEDCEGMIYRQVKVYQSAGMIFVEMSGAGGNQYVDVKGTRRPGTNRLHVAGADGFHSQGTRKGALLERVEIGFVSDDLVNFYGKFGRVLAQDGQRVTLTPGGKYMPTAGDELCFRDYQSMADLGRARILTAERSDDKSWTVTLEHSLKLPAETLVYKEGLDSPGWVIRNCYMHHTFNRNMQLKSEGVVENSWFTQVFGSGSNITGNSVVYAEGFFPSHVTIRGNVFLNTGHLNADFVPFQPGYLRTEMPLRDLSIVGNYLENGNVSLKYVDGGRVEDNLFVGPRPQTPIVALSVTEGIHVSRNTVMDGPDAAWK